LRTSSTLVLHAVLVSSLAGQSGGGAWESLPGSTRAAGLGGAGAALVGDAGAVFSNPAGIATIRHLSVEGGYQHFAGGSAVASGALALRAGRLSWGLARPPATPRESCCTPRTCWASRRRCVGRASSLWAPPSSTFARRSPVRPLVPG